MHPDCRCEPNRTNPAHLMREDLILTRLILGGLLAVAVISMNGKVQAQCGYPQFGCGGFCLVAGNRFHAHGPLYSYSNYGIAGSGYGYNAYGSGFANGHCFGLNRAPMSRGFLDGGGFGLNILHGGLFGNRGCNSCGGSGYALSTFHNVLHRLNPLAGRGCGTGCMQNSCGTCASTVGSK